MKRVLTILLSIIMLNVFDFLLNSAAAQTPQQIMQILNESKAQCEITPDSIFPTIRRLEQMKADANDVVTRAVLSECLAIMYENNRWMAQHNSIGEKLEEWGRGQWDEAAMLNRADARAPMDELRAARASKWGPLITQNKNDIRKGLAVDAASWFGGDLLHVLLFNQPTEEIAQYYERNVGGNAAVLARLEMNPDREALRQMLDKALGDKQISAAVRVLVYKALIVNLQFDDKDEAVRLGDECMAAYGKEKVAAGVRNLLLSLREPYFNIQWPELCYPGREYRVPVSYRNISRFTVHVNEQTLEYTCQSVDAHVDVEDTITFTAPAKGTYNVTFEPVNKMGVIKQRNNHDACKMYVSPYRLLRLAQAKRDEVQYIVVDGMTGQRADDQKVEIYNEPTRYRRDNMMVRIVGDPQPAVEHQHTWGWTFNNDDYSVVNIYTDRAIYRPGQTVHLSSLIYRQHHWSAMVDAGRKVDVRVHDRNRNEIFRDTLTTDQFGCISTTFILPTNIPLGYCRITVADNIYSFKVEEYKRPTFEVMLDDKLHETDSTATVTLTARNFNGTPVRGAKVTGSAVVRHYWWRWNEDETHSNIDTLYTDAEGNLHIPVTVPKTEEERRYRCVEVNVTVTAETGETHSGMHIYRLSNEARPQDEPETMPVGAPSWFYMRNNVISPNKPAVIEVGSALHDVHLFCSVFREDKCIRQEEIAFSDSLLTFEYGYDLIADYPDCDGVGVTVAFMKDERLYSHSFALKRQLPDTNLRWAWTTFRDRVQPGNREQWCGTLLTPDGQPADAHAMFTIYDASLDEFVRHNWRLGVSRDHNIVTGNYSHPTSLHTYYHWTHYDMHQLKVPYLSYYALSHDWLQGGRGYRVGGAMLMKQKYEAMYSASAAAPMMSRNMAAGALMSGKVMKESIVTMDCADDCAEDENGEADAALSNVKARGDFRELACFEPSLRTNACGQLTLNFTLPDCMTTWNIFGVAHTQDMMTAEISSQTVAQKTMMCMVDVPRFLRMGDRGSVAVTLQNVSGERQNVTLRVELIDSETGEVTETLAKALSIVLDDDKVMHFTLPVQTRPFIVKAVAVSGDNSDGEQREVPVLDDSEWIANATDLLCRGEGEHVFSIDSLFAGNASDRRMTIHYTESPIWTAIDVMRNINMPQHDDVISLHTALYATVLTNYLAEQHSEVAAYLDYKQDEAHARATSLLERLGILQNVDGGYSWFNGFYPSYWLTLEVATTFARLQSMTGQHYDQADRAMSFLAAEVAKMIKERKREKVDYCTVNDLQYLYTRALMGKPLDADARYLLDKFVKQSAPDTDGKIRMSRELMAVGTVVLRAFRRDAEAREMERQLRHYIVRDERQGAFFSYLRGSFTCIDRKLMDHIYAMEAVEGDEQLLPDMRRWLLQQKRVQAWENPIYNAAAVYALLLGNTYNLDGKMHDRIYAAPLLTSPKGEEVPLVEIQVPLVDVQGEGFGKIVVEKHNPTESWGAVYVENRMKIDDIKANNMGLAVRRYVEKRDAGADGSDGESIADALGDVVQVRLVITADRDYEHVHLVVPRPACLEPVETLSSHHYQGGLLYYHEVHDAVDDLFIERLPKGAYVLTINAHAVRPGTYNAGITKIRCEYAPEFCGNTENVVIEL